MKKQSKLLEVAMIFLRSLFLYVFTFYTVTLAFSVMEFSFGMSVSLFALSMVGIHFRAKPCFLKGDYSKLKSVNKLYFLLFTAIEAAALYLALYFSYLYMRPNYTMFESAVNVMSNNTEEVKNNVRLLLVCLPSIKQNEVCCQLLNQEFTGNVGKTFTIAAVCWVITAAAQCPGIIYNGRVTK